MRWRDVDVSGCTLVAARQGGPLAVLPWNVETDAYSTRLEVYTFSGILMSTVHVGLALRVAHLALELMTLLARRLTRSCRMASAGLDCFRDRDRECPVLLGLW
jgi:hypothetical protein